jgi:phage FluMu protein Com
MRCSHCQSLMLEAEIVREGHTELTWHECPTCGRLNLYSRMLDASESGCHVLAYPIAGTARIVARSFKR